MPKDERIFLKESNAKIERAIEKVKAAQTELFRAKVEQAIFMGAVLGAEFLDNRLREGRKYSQKEVTTSAVALARWWDKQEEEERKCKKRT